MTIRARGLKENKRAWGAMAKAVASAQVAYLASDSDKVAKEGRARLVARQDGFIMDRQPGSIGFDVVRKGRNNHRIVVYLERDGTTPAAEFGAKTHHVFGRKMRQRDMRRRTAAGWGRKGRLVGWQYQARRNRRRQQRLADKGVTEIRRTLRRFGAP